MRSKKNNFTSKYFAHNKVSVTTLGKLAKLKIAKTFNISF